MWEDLVFTESKGKLRAQNLNWFPDPRIEMAAFSETAGVGEVVRTHSGTDYFALADASVHGVLRLQGELTAFNWISPYSPSLLQDVQKSSSESRYIDLTASEILGCPSGITTYLPFVDGYCWDHLYAGATTQLALVLFSADRLFHLGISPDFVTTSVRTDLLGETSKLRALRVLLEHLARLHELNEYTWRIIAVSSSTCFSPVDQENNMIRNTIAGISGILGTADALALQPWNVLEKGYSDSDAAVLSHNLFHLLCDESQLDKIADPLAGSYSVENLTDALIQKGWELFLELRELTPKQVSDRLNSDILQADRQNYAQGGRHVDGKKIRSIIGQTHFAESSDHGLAPPSGLFPMPKVLEFTPSIHVGDSK
jgi:hypothetical protein